MRVPPQPNDGYIETRRLPTGEWAAIKRFLFTTGLIVGIDGNTHRTRFCYPDADSARLALRTWNGTGDPPGLWIKEKSVKLERRNPARFKGIPIEEAPPALSLTRTQ